MTTGRIAEQRQAAGKGLPIGTRGPRRGATLKLLVCRNSWCTCKERARPNASLRLTAVTLSNSSGITMAATTAAPDKYREPFWVAS